MTIRILIADDHAMVRTGLTQLLSAEDDMEIVGAAADGAEAADLAIELLPDLILMDLSMPEVDGVEATRRVVAGLPDVRVLVLTSFSERERVLEAIDAGAVGYMLKDAEPDELIRAIRAAARGESPLDPKVASALFERRAEDKTVQALTPREREVLVMVGKGLTNKQIGRRLGIAEKTVKAHLTNVFQRIDVQDRTQAALWAERHGLLSGG